MLRRNDCWFFFFFTFLDACENVQILSNSWSIIKIFSGIGTNKVRFPCIILNGIDRQKEEHFILLLHLISIEL